MNNFGRTTVISTVVVLLTVTIGILIFVVRSTEPVFDSSLWKKDRLMRWEMLESLKRSGNLAKGTSQNVVMTLLGHPDQINPPSKFGDKILEQNCKTIWSYGVGAHSGMRMDEDYFAVAFDFENRVFQVWVWQS